MNHFSGSRAGYRSGAAGLWVVALLSVGCGSYGFNYLHPTEPRCAGRIRDAPPALAPGDTCKVASFNIKFAQNVERALRTLRDAGLGEADVLLLQEMDPPGTEAIARDLGYDFVYYPASFHPAASKQFGVSILSPWPIRADHKIRLPQLRGSDDAQKVASAAVVWVRGVPVGVVNVHFESGLSPVALGDEVQILTQCLFTTLCDQAGAPMLAGLPHYVMAGDFNSRSSAHIEVLRELLGWSGLAQVPGIGPTQKYVTAAMGRIDHIFASQNLEVVEAAHVKGFFNTGSDHRPVWASLRFPKTDREAWHGFDESPPWSASPPSGDELCSCRGPDCLSARGVPQRDVFR